MMNDFLGLNGKNGASHTQYDFAIANCTLMCNSVRAEKLAQFDILFLKNPRTFQFDIFQ